MFGIGLGEIFILVLIIFLVNGPERLPELARKLGRYARDFKRITDEVKTTIDREINRPDEPKILPPAQDAKADEKKNDGTA